MAADIKTFHGLRNGTEDPKEYIEDIEFFFEYNLVAKGREDYVIGGEERVFRILFRKNLCDNALKWYRQLASEIKLSWKLLKERFIEEYNAQTNVASIRYTLEIVSLSQLPGENITAYLQRAEALHEQAPALDDIIGINFLKGMQDTSQKSPVNFECARARDYSFTYMKPIVKTVFDNGTQSSVFNTKPSDGLFSERTVDHNEHLKSPMQLGGTTNAATSGLFGNSKKSGSLFTFSSSQSPKISNSGPALF